MGKKKSNSAGAGGRRPRRQRTQVQHYTDDIPGTFTKKKKRRRGSDDSDNSSDSESDDDNSHHPQLYDQRRTIHFDEYASVEEAASKAKKKRKRPAKPESNNATTASSRSMPSSSALTKQPGNKQQLKQQPPPVLQPRKLQEKPTPPPPKTTMLQHTTSVAPILPLANTCPLARDSLEQQYPVMYGRGLGAPQAPTTPEWNLISQQDFYFPEDYLQVKVACTPVSETDEEPRTALAPVLKEGPWPVCRVVTSICSYGNQWMAVGDSAGFVLLFRTGPSALHYLARLDTSASKREHARQRQVQSEVELRCRHKPELLEKRSPFWATAKTPNAIQCMTWTQNLIIVLTAQEIEALQLTSGNAFEHQSQVLPSMSKGGSQHCKILWRLPIATVGPRKNGSNSLLTGGELVGSYLELHKKGTMVLWNTWGVAIAKAEGEETSNSSAGSDNEQGGVRAEDDWPLLLLRDPKTKANDLSSSPEFIKIIPFQRDEEEEKPPPVPIKRSPGRPPKKKPKPKIPVNKGEHVWTETSKCHAAMWDNHAHKGDRVVIAYSKTATLSASDAQVLLCLLKLTDDTSKEEPPLESTGPSPQFARLLKQTAVPLVASARNIANVPEVTLQQSTKGTYTLVAGSRGVRMYETESMTLLRVYGENVSLHGKGMVWKSCFVLDNRLQQQLYRQQEEQLTPPPTDNLAVAAVKADNHQDEHDDDDEPTSKTILRQNRQGFVWIEHENALASFLDAKDSSSQDSGKMVTRRRSSMQRIRASSSFDDQDDDDEEDDEADWLHQAWIVGIPHPFRGPKELQETLYFWQGIEKLPLFTLPLPHQSGGVQDMLPLVSAAASNSHNRSVGMWLRFMVATVHGECMELAPSVKSDFAGNMYNPGYLVVRDNVEYIEDEDELDKVMVEVREEGDESEKEEAVIAPPLGTQVGGEIVDEELQEAIRLSLLESQGRSNADDGSDDENEIVVVRDVFGDDVNELVIPCEPEPFLRKKLLPDYESDTMINVNDAATRDISVNDAEFAREVLAMLPQSKSAQAKWDQQKDIAPPKNILEEEEDQFAQPPAAPTNGSGNATTGAFPGKSLGKGKRTRPGNIETMMKASIVPELRQYMIDRSRCWSDGAGVSLQADAWDHAVSGVKDSRKEGVAATPGSTSQASKVQEKQDDACYRTEGTSGEENKVPPSMENGNGKESITSTTTGELSVTIPKTSREDVEKEIALELLQLSPRPKAPVTPRVGPPDLSMAPDQPVFHPSKADNGDSSEVDLGGMKVAIIELKDYSGLAEQYSCTGTVDIPLTLEDCGIAVDSESTQEKDERQVENPREDLDTKLVEDADATTTERKALDDAKKPKQDVSLESKRGSSETFRCSACQGRLVIHTCGKRALPVDFEAIARAEKERKEREEEEKKRLKIEKRKQADAKRREAKKLKKEREKREKLEKEAELRRLREAKIAEARANMANIGDCLDTSSPQVNGVSKAAVGSSEEGVELPKGRNENATAGGIHVAIADAWNEHAEKFTAKTASATTERPGTTQNTPVSTQNGGWQNGQVKVPNALESNTLDTLASMAEAASPQVQTPLQQQKQSTSSTPSTPVVSPAPAPVGQQHAQHGFFSSPEASSTSAAMIARRNQVLNSYHAMEAGANAAGAPVAKARIVDLSNQGHAALNAPREARAHSFQISPLPNSNPQNRMLGQQHLSVFQRHSGVPAAAPRPAQPYFGYTQLSTYFRPRVNLGSYSSATIITRPPQPAAPVPPPRADIHQAHARPPAVAASAMAPPASATATNAGVWVHHAQALPPPARPVPAPMMLQPQLGHTLAPPAAAHMPAPGHVPLSTTGMASAQYHHHLRGVQAAPGSAPGANLNQHVVYKNPTTTTNP